MCRRPTTSAAARRDEPHSGKPSGSSGWRARWLVWTNAIARRQVRDICRRCWARHVEVSRLDESEREDRAAELVARWLRDAPLADARSVESGEGLPLSEAARLCTAAGLFMLGDGRGLYAWRPGDRRFRFDSFQEPAQSGSYDSVLVRYDYYNSYEASVYRGTVRRHGDGVVLFWRYERAHDSSR